MLLVPRRSQPLTSLALLKRADNRPYQKTARSVDLQCINGVLYPSAGAGELSSSQL